MAYQLYQRLCRAEAALLLQGRPFPQLLVCPVGMPVDIPPGGLAILIHQPWCDDAGHEGACAPRPEAP